MGISKKQSTNVRLNLPASSRCGKGKFIEVIFETPALRTGTLNVTRFLEMPICYSKMGWAH
jgi:hypothetical protein